MKDKPSIFISYSWQTKEIAEKIFNDLRVIGVSIVMDNQELNYTDNIPTFMKRIRESKYALLLISDNYLKSKNCLFEVLELLKDEKAWEKVLPIVCKETKIYTVIDRIKYISFWQQKVKEIELALDGINPINATHAYKELKLFQDISFNIDSFLKNISDSLHFSPEEIIKKKYQPLIDKLGIDFEPKPLIALLGIYLNGDLEQREIALDNYIKENPESTYYYSIKAGTSRDLKKFKQAIYYYNKGLELNPDNVEILNNLGQVLEKVNQDYKKAKECYERAIKVNPVFDIPRLNLGVLLSHHFNDIKGAKKQYEEILKFDPNNSKAHNNLANTYKVINPTKKELEIAEFHLKKALEINPNYIDALINYGNFLKVYRKEFDKGNEYYLKVKELVKEGNLKEFIDLLLNTNKS